MQVAASAPGKIIVAGEYAVLQDAPAICIAINRRARVSITRSGAAAHCVLAPGYRQEEKQFENIAEVAGDQPLLAAIWERFPMASVDRLRIEIDTRSFHSGSQKLGIGSSAAAAVALTAAFDAISQEGGESGGDVGAHAQAAHRSLQGGQGSGADVATSNSWRVIEYRMNKSASASLSWPENLHYALLWSGRSSSTAAQLQKLAGVGSSAAGEALSGGAEDVAAAWRTGAAQPILVALRHYTDALRLYDDEYRLDIFSAGHARISELAAAEGLVYKPSGAGGGDFGIAVADDLEALQALVATAEDEGFVYSDLAIDPVGLVVEQE